MISDAIALIDELKAELDAVRPLPPDVNNRIGQRLRIEMNYESNAIEGNALNIGETRSLILYGITARGKPLRDHLDIQGHDDALKTIERAIEDNQTLTHSFIRGLHKILLREPYKVPALTPDGVRTTRRIAIGEYKSMPNSVETQTGEILYYCPPEQVQSAMTDLLDWYRYPENQDEHPIIIAATMHYRFVKIHPFDDGNGRMARLLMNMILIKHGYTVAIIRREQRNGYLRTLDEVQRTERLATFIDYVAASCRYSLDLHLRAARGQSIEEEDDIDQEISLFKQSIMTASDTTAAFAARDYFDNILSPFHDYCEKKIVLFSDVASTADVGEYSLDIRTPDQKRVTINRYSLGALMIPSDASWMSFEFYATVGELWRQETSFRWEIKNERSSQRSKWCIALSVSGGDGLYDYLKKMEFESGDLKVLKMRFSETIRRMMAKVPKEGRSSHNDISEPSDDRDTNTEHDSTVPDTDWIQDS